MGDFARRFSADVGRELPATMQEHDSIPLNISNILLRGSVLRNTDWVIGLVAYTGKETKVLLNSGRTPHKRSRIERKMDVQVLLTFGILVLLCLGVTIAHMIYNKHWQASDAPWYNADFPTGPVYGLITFWSAMILFQNLIPISLYVTIEIAKMLQVKFFFCILCFVLFSLEPFRSRPSSFSSI
jgi:phospholipid-translocating ATPase